MRGVRRRRRSLGPLALLLVLACCVGVALAFVWDGQLPLAGGEERRIEASVSEALNRFGDNADEEGVASLLDGAGVDRAELRAAGIDAEEFARHLLSHFAYRIDDVSVEGDHALVRLAVTSTNGLELASQLIGEFSRDGEEQVDLLLQEEGDRMLTDEFFAQLYERVDAQATEVTREVTLHLSRVDGSWEADAPSVRELARAMLGAGD